MIPNLVDTLASYVPALITSGLTNNPAPISKPQVDCFPAAVLFADISGFTGLTEQLAKEGPAGTEQLARLLNMYFGRLVDYRRWLYRFCGGAAGEPKSAK